jgi:spore germination cell wall hydrolase CwlJ-like protein
VFGLFIAGVAQAETDRQALSDFRAVQSLQRHLPLNVPETKDLVDSEKRDIECLSWNLYFEVRGSRSLQEQLAVAWVPINRMTVDHFGRDICANVFQYGWAGGIRRYQFSWAGIVLGNNWRREDDSWVKMQQLAVMVYRGQVEDPGRGSTYFNNVNVGNTRGKLRLGSHVFWRR